MEQGAHRAHHSLTWAGNKASSPNQAFLARGTEPRPDLTPESSGSRFHAQGQYQQTCPEIQTERNGEQPPLPKQICQD